MTLVKNIRVLCLDSDPDELKQMSTALIANELEVATVSQPDEAISSLVKNEYEIVIADMKVLGENHKETLHSIKKANPFTVIILLAEQNVEDAVPAGIVFAAIEKPFTSDELISNINKAHTFYKEKNFFQKNEKDNEDRMKFQLEWLLWKQRSNIQDKMKFTGIILESIRHSITQGMGIGSLVTLSEMMEMGKKETDDKYTIPRDIVDSIINSAMLLRNWLETFNHVNVDFSRSFEPENLSNNQLEMILKNSVVSVSAIQKVKKHDVIIDNASFPESIVSHPTVLDMALRELLTNAFKFSPESSTVNILRFKSGSSFSISVINDILPMQGGVAGIPVENENFIFEPFYRLNNVIDERYLSGRTGMGLGLTMIQKIVNDVGGRLYIHEFNDHTLEQVKRRVIAELLFPMH